MKSLYSFKSLPCVVSLFSCVCLSGCYDNPAEEILQSSGKAKLNVVTRSSSNNELEYPLVIYAFDDSGNCKAEKVVKDSETAPSITLSEGNYRLVAVAGCSDYEMPSSISLSSEIATQNDNCSASQLAIGQSDVKVGSATSTVTLQMALQVASVEMELGSLPEDVSTVKISIAKQYQSVTFGGEYKGEENTVIDCKKVGDVWTTGKFYVFPSSSNSTVFSITAVDDSGVHNYGYTYSAKLKAGQPYRLNGTFSSGFDVNGSIDYSGWNNEIVLDFNFGDGMNESGGNNTNPEENQNGNESSFSVNSIPKPGSIVKGHVVALVSNETATSADVLLISLAEWNKVEAAASSKNPEEALDIAAEYSEEGLGGWRIPSKDEATLLKKTYGGENLSTINNVLESADGALISATEDNGGNARYLCESANYSFTFNGETSSITKVGATVKYRLRLVKTVRVTI